MPRSKKLPKTIKPPKPETIVRKSMTFLKDLELKPRQILFIYFYCENNFNGTKAYQLAGYEGTDENTIASQASTMIRNPKIVEGVRLYLELILEPSRTVLEKQLFDVWFKRAFYDPSMFVNLDGDPVHTSWDSIPVEWRVCVDGIETKHYGKDATMSRTTIKLANRQEAMVQLDRYIGMTKETKQIELIDIPDTRKKELAKMLDVEK